MRYASKRHHRLAAGFTTLELVVAMAIGAILVAVAIPSFIDVIATQRVKTAAFDFYTGLILARSEAIKRNAVVDIAPRGGDFANGWDIRAGGTVLSSRLGMGGIAVSVPAGVTLAYDQDGRLTSAGRYDARLTATGNASVAARCVIVDPGGRPSIKTDANRDGNCFNG